MAPTPLRHVFLTGANGFVGSHILAQLLQRPSIQIRAAVRSKAKADQVRSDFPHASSRLSFAIVPDITASDAFDHAFANADPPFDAVIHTASLFAFGNVASNIEFLDPAVKGTTEILRATKALAPEVKRVIITSSFAAVGDWNLRPDADKIYTADDWNPTTWDEAMSRQGIGGVRSLLRRLVRFSISLVFLRNESDGGSTYSIRLFEERKAGLRDRSSQSTNGLRPPCAYDPKHRPTQRVQPQDLQAIREFNETGALATEWLACLCRCQGKLYPPPPQPSVRYPSEPKSAMLSH